MGLDMNTNTLMPGTYGSTLPAFESCVDVSTSVNNGLFYIDVFVLNVSQLLAFEADLNFGSGKMQILQSDAFQFLGPSSNVSNISQSVTPIFTGTTVNPPVNDGAYAAAAFATAGYTSGPGVLVRLQAQAFLPPSGGRVIDLHISTDATEGVTLTNNAYGHPGDTNGDGIFDGPFINRVGKIAVDRPDGDGDGISNDCDNCPTTSNADQLDTDGDGLGNACDPDDDNDGVADASDNCPTVPNPTQSDVNSNGIGDACEDSDGDGILDGLDNCPSLPNANQANNDGDSLGDACDPDDDNDSVADTSDNCQMTANTNQNDWNSDGIGDACQNFDGDSFLDAVDNCPGVTNEGQADTDLDGLGDVCDNCPTAPNASQADFNNDGVGDACQNTDGDYVTFNDAEEVFVGTLPGVKCPADTSPNNEAIDAWPPDFNDDRSVGLQDVLQLIPVYLTNAPGPPYNKRFDLNADNKIGLPDVLGFIPVYLATCIP